MYLFFFLFSCERGRLNRATTTTTKSLQSCPTLCDPIDGRQPTRLPCPWDSPGTNTGVGHDFLLQCMKMKGEREVSQSCPIPSDPMDCSLPGSSVHGIFQSRVLEWGATAFSKGGLGPRNSHLLKFCTKQYGRVREKNALWGVGLELYKLWLSISSPETGYKIREQRWWLYQL